MDSENDLLAPGGRWTDLAISSATGPGTNATSVVNGPAASGWLKAGARPNLERARASTPTPARATLARMVSSCTPGSSQSSVVQRVRIASVSGESSPLLLRTQRRALVRAPTHQTPFSPSRRRRLASAGEMLASRPTQACRARPSTRSLLVEGSTLAPKKMSSSAGAPQAAIGAVADCCGSMDQQRPTSARRAARPASLTHRSSGDV